MKNKLKTIFTSLFGSKNYFRIINWMHPQKTKLWDIELILHNYSKYEDNIRFVQIGSNDGVYDPIRKFVLEYKWKGILVEPIPYLFNQLKANYSNTNDLEFYNVGIDKENGERNIYYVDQNFISASNILGIKCLQGIGSFQDNFYKKFETKFGSLKDVIKNELVPIITFNNLVKNIEDTKVNIIHIDTEGYDYEIIKTIDLIKFQVDLLIFEHIHIDAKELKQCYEKLEKLNYKIFYYLGDSIAIKNSLVKTVL